MKIKKEFLVLLVSVVLLIGGFSFAPKLDSHITTGHSGGTVITTGFSHTSSSGVPYGTSMGVSESRGASTSDSAKVSGSSVTSGHSESKSEGVSYGTTDPFTEIDSHKLQKINKIMEKHIDNSLIYRQYQYDLSLLPDSILDKLIKNNIKINVIDEVKDTDKNNTIGRYWVEGKYIDIEGKEYNRGCILHEVGHAIDYGLLDNYNKSSNVTLYSSTNEYKNIFNSERNIMSQDEYHNDNIGEYFAESFIYYFMSEDYKTQCPKSYTYVKSIIK